MLKRSQRKEYPELLETQRMGFVDALGCPFLLELDIWSSRFDTYTVAQLAGAALNALPEIGEMIDRRDKREVATTWNTPYIKPAPTATIGNEYGPLSVAMRAFAAPIEHGRFPRHVLFPGHLRLTPAGPSNSDRRSLLIECLSTTDEPGAERYIKIWRQMVNPFGGYSRSGREPDPFELTGITPQASSAELIALTVKGFMDDASLRTIDSTADTGFRLSS